MCRAVAHLQLCGENYKQWREERNCGPQSNDRNRGLTELVQHFAYRRSSHQLKGATSIKLTWFGYAAGLSQWASPGNTALLT
jgi:hypothetical protein